jgi:ribosomal-protein-alanine N-acetyltransferase
VEVGYDLKEIYWGNGYMQEAMREILTFAREKMLVKEIRACIAVDNQRSIHLAKKFGFALSGSTTLVFRGQNFPHHIYALALGQ